MRSLLFAPGTAVSDPVAVVAEERPAARDSEVIALVLSSLDVEDLMFPLAASAGVPFFAFFVFFFFSCDVER